MRVRVLRAFTVGGRIYRPGCRYDVAELVDDVAELERCGWLVLVDADDNVLRLQTPEDGQALTLRNNPSSPASAGVSMAPSLI